MAIRCPRGTKVQSVLFPKRKFSPAKARTWLKKHGLRARIAKEGIRSRAEYWHAPQLDPKRYRTVGSGRWGKQGIMVRYACPPTKRKAVARKKPRRRTAANPVLAPGRKLYFVKKRKGKKTVYYATTDHSPFTRGGRMKTKEVASPNTLFNYIEKKKPGLLSRMIVWVEETTKKAGKLEITGWKRAKQYWGMAVK